MANKYYKAYKFVVGGKKRPGIVGVKPKSGGVVDEFKSKKLKDLGKTQKRLESQDKAIGTEMSKARDRGATRKQLVKGRKFQRDIRRAKREGDKLRKDVLRVGKARGGVPAPMRPRDKRKSTDNPTDKGPRRKLKPVRPDQKGLQSLPKPVRNKMGYMKDGGKVKKFPDLSGDGKVTKKDVLIGRGVIKRKK